MSFVGTLAKVAIGVALAKGFQTVSERSRTSGTRTGTGAGTGGLFGGAHSPKTGSQSGGLGGLIEQVTGGGAGGLGGLLGGLTGAAGSRNSGGSVLGGLGDLLGNRAPQGSSVRNFGDMLEGTLANGGRPAQAPTADQEAIAALLLRAMIQAAKSDGEVDEAENQKLVEHLGEISAEERDFVEAEMARPVDVAALVRDVPPGLQAQVYTMSLMAIDLDHQTEAQYLDQLARGLGLDKAAVNSIHDEMGVPTLYT
ncbi:tellurite resistance TerB family protein [Rhodobacter ferrooxidans]|uniref:Tellurite resistance TerB family protein n=1 Tax=Rhodobacter ferrooxidans TaxID=371731 RepID=C8S2L1_9RHOB|nr:tellurite resistance TerB family protein [Rhodobacter sp. SW2]EEW24882.1 protein of unknown function DUF533 [Rhodobacter sp. SW2]